LPIRKKEEQKYTVAKFRMIDNVITNFYVRQKANYIAGYVAALSPYYVFSSIKCQRQKNTLTF